MGPASEDTGVDMHEDEEKMNSEDMVNMFNGKLGAITLLLCRQAGKIEVLGNCEGAGQSVVAIECVTAIHVS